MSKSRDGMNPVGQFDFWLGSWNVSWDEGAHGRNVVTKILGGSVVLEQFDGRPGMELEGLSVSVYDPQADRWRQTWVDTEQNYMSFTGRFDADVMDLRTVHNGVPHRMRWHDISADALTWDWERETNGGWELLWQLEYRRLA